MLNFIKVRGNDGVKLHTALFPHSQEIWKSSKPRATMVFFHAYGSYIEKNAPVLERFQKQGYEVVGYDIRCFGKSSGEPKGLIKDTRLLASDAINFLRAFESWDLERGLGTQPILLYGYSFGATNANLAYRYLW